MTDFRPMRRIRQQLPYDECIEILNQATSGVLALHGDNDYPYALPISFVYSDGCIYFHSAVEGHKIDAIRRDERCSFCVIDADDVQPATFTTHFKSVIAFGRIQIIEDDDERLRVLRLLGQRYSPNDHKGLQHEIDTLFSRVAMLCLRIEHITGKEAKELMQQRVHQG